MFELTVKVSNEEQAYRKKFIEYAEDIILNMQDPKLKASVDQAINEFPGANPEVQLTIKMIWS